MFFIYFLYSHKADKYYIGQTNDVVRRLKEHNNPQTNSKYTAKYIPLEIKLQFPVSDNHAQALLVERFIKNQKSRKFVLS